MGSYGPYVQQIWDGETLFGGFARVLTMAPVGTRAPRRAPADRGYSTRKRVAGKSLREVRAERKAARNIELELPQTRNAWTLVDSTLYRKEGNNHLGNHVKARCSCGFEKLHRMVYWVSGYGVSRCCDKCSKQLRRAIHDNFAKSTPKVIIPYARVAGE